MEKKVELIRRINKVVGGKIPVTGTLNQNLPHKETLPSELGNHNVNGKPRLKL